MSALSQLLVVFLICNTSYGQTVDKAGARLVSGSSTSAGILELWHNGSWRTVCKDSVDTSEAALICRQLGFLPIGSEIEDGAQYDLLAPESMSLYVECNNDNCTIREQKCAETAALRCLPCLLNGPTRKLFYCPEGTVKESGVVCIYNEHQCDEVIDCSGGEDEFHCTTCNGPEDNGNIKLVDGHSVREGRLEICMNRRWGTVCDNKFDRADALVICRQLGLSTSRAKFRRFGFGHSSLPIWLDNLECNGFEDNILDCRSHRRHSCGHFQDVGVMCLPAITDSLCENGDLRLDTSVAAVGGRVEICSDGIWGSICNEEWTIEDARVACNQLGLPLEGTTIVSDISSVDAVIALSGLNCTGDEKKLIDCPNLGFGNHECTPNQAAGLYCGSCVPGDILCMGTDDDPQCISELNVCDGLIQCPAGDDELNGSCICTTPGELRLVGGAGLREGRVEMCYRGQWGTVCDEGWDNRDAEVVCSQLGFGAIDAVAHQMAFFGPGVGPIVLKGVDCTGNEDHLLDCPTSNQQDLNCTHSRDAAVSCAPCNSDQFQCSSGTVSGNGSCINSSQICDGVNDCVGGEDEQNIRLVGGTLPIEGRVEYCMGGEWSTICDDNWDNNDAKVVCRQLGYDIEDARALCCATYGRGTEEQTILPLNYYCTGGEKNLSQCNTRSRGGCSHSEDAGVICRCSENTFPCQEATLDNPICITELQFCDGISNCPEGSDEPDDCPKECLIAGELQLVNGDSTDQNKGRVEVCFGGRWGSVCDDSWDYYDAAVVCRQLGFGTLGAVAQRGSFYGQGTGPVHLDDVNCQGIEGALINCSRRRFGSVGSNCRAHFEDASVICPTICPDHQYQCKYGRIDAQQSPCISADQRCDGVTDCIGGEDELDHNCPCGPEGAVRLVDGIVPYRGRVEICVNGRWSGICSAAWHYADAVVVCRELGYPSEGARASCCGLFGTGPDKQPHFRDRFNCRGDERNLSMCPRSVGADCPANQQDVVVLCNIPEQQFPCLNRAPEYLSNVTELQFCDGIDDCGDNSDEPSYCSEECLEPGKLRLVNGEEVSMDRGRVEICLGGQWGTICDDSWDYHDAEVVCRQLGLGTAGALAYSGSRYNPGSGPIYLDDVACSGSENSINDCSRGNYGYASTNCRSHFEDASVLCPIFCPDDMFECSHGRVGDQLSPCVSTDQRCDGITDCIGGEDELDHNCPCGPEGAVRLVDGIVPYRGRVEICKDKRWRSICSGRWGYRDATVVCRQLGYPTEGAQALCCGKYSSGPERQPVVREYFNCQGNERNLSECSKSIGIECAHNRDVSVTCSINFDDFRCEDIPPDIPSNVTELQFCDGMINCTDGSDEPQYCPAGCLVPGEVRLVNNGLTNLTEGRVEICFGGEWGTVCDDSWDYHDAEVVCRQLGLGTRGAIVHGGSWYGPGTGPIHLDEVHCIGSENALTSCPFQYFGDVSSNCRSHLEDASVICSSVCAESSFECRYGHIDDQESPCVSAEQRCDGVTDCIGGEDELDHNCPCGPEGAVRLVDGTVPYRGRVEYCKSGWWSTICNYYSYHWGNSDAAVVCHQLGYPREGAEAHRGKFLAAHISQPLVFDYFQCGGSESNLLECGRRIGRVCYHNTDVSVVCKCSEVNAFQCINESLCVSELQLCDGVADCSNGTDESVNCGTECSTPGKVRLVNGEISNGHEGRVEVCFKGYWGTVCQDSWDYQDAEIVCRQLGFTASGAIPHTGSHYGPGKGPVYLNNVGCVGSESNLTECSHSYFGDVSSTCKTHLYDVSVSCVTECQYGELKCTDGQVNGQQPPCISTDQRCNGVTDCIGGEDELDHNCPCGPEGAVRLVDGTVPYQGRVEFCKSGWWSTICSYYTYYYTYYWDNSDAAVVCHQLGYPREGAEAHRGKFLAAHNSQPLVFDYFHCGGSESNLLECGHSIGRVCYHNTDVSVVCKCSEVNAFQCINESLCVNELQLCDGVADCSNGTDESVNCGTECSTPGKVRLVNGEISNGHEGRVEVCFKGYWGTVCHDSWDYRDAEVVCRQLGFTASGAIPHTGSHYGPGTGPVYLNNVGCVGSESNLTECSHSYFGDVSSTCKTHLYDVSVSCVTECQYGELKCTDGQVNGQQSPCISTDQRCDGVTNCIGGEDELDHNCPCRPEGAVRLVDGTIPYRGRVEFCKSGWWSTICSYYTYYYTYYWDNSDAAVVCHQLGYPREGAEAHRGKFLAAHNSQPLVFDYFHCGESESNLLECGHSIGRVCYHNTDVSVVCKCSEVNAFQCINESLCVNELQLCDGVADCSNGTDESVNCGTECSTPGKVRLVNGEISNGHEGRVEVCFKGYWGTVCHDSWDYRDAEVVCRQLGFTASGAIPYTGSHYGPGKGPVYLNNVGCVGSESNLTECSHSYFGDVSSTCKAHLADASVLCATECQFEKLRCTNGQVNGQQSPCISADQCCDGVTDCIGGEDELDHNCPCGPEGAVRLVDGTVPYRGRVEFCKSGWWSTICSYYTYYYTYYWDNSDAAVVCHQLGYPREGAEAHRGKFLVAHISQPLVFDYFHCGGSESNLLECGHSIGRVCYHNTDVSVVCKCSEVNAFQCINESLCVNELQLCDGVADCSNGTDESVNCGTECSTPGKVRLVNGEISNGHEGRVEVCFKGYWGTVCHDSWDYRDAEVVCRQLGFTASGAIPHTGSHYGPGTGPVYLNNVGCVGSESNLTECSHSYFGDVSSTCKTHIYDVSVSCVTECQYGELKCTDGQVNGQQPPCISTDQRCNGVTDCIGGEDELDHNCPCGPEGAVRLVDGTVPYRGRVEFCKSGWWSTICSYYTYYWDNSDAAVVCHQLGYPREGAEAHRGKFLAAHNSQPLVFDYFHCGGSESNLLECGHSIGHVCYHNTDVSVICKCSQDKLYMCSNDTNVCVNELQVCDKIEHCPSGTDEIEDCPTECTPGEVRLVNGGKAGGYEGRVEICFKGLWGTVCHDSWDTPDAEVVCRQLGFGSMEASTFRDSHYGPGEGPVYLNSVRCTGTENSLTDCSHSLFGDVSSSCTTHLYDASVKCPLECSADEIPCRDGRINSQNSSCISIEQQCDGIVDCVGGEDEYCANICSPEGAVRLVGGRGPHEGRVEFCKNGEWTTICGKRSWDRADAAVVCHQLGYPTDNADAQCCSSSRFGFGYDTQPIDVELLLCNGNEGNLSECERTIGTSCEHTDDASVICNCQDGTKIPCAFQDTMEPTCVSELQLCDGITDCPDSSGGSDENNCAIECSTPGEVQLVNSHGNSRNEGRVEVCFKGLWGTVCDDSWDYHDAEVVCRQLGYGAHGAKAFSGSHYGPGNGSVYLDDINCIGSEDMLVNCSRRLFGDISTNCKTHLEDASVLCTTVCSESTFECSNGQIDGQQPPCISTDQRCDGIIDCVGGEDELDHNCPCGPEGAVRLVDGIVPYRGRVEFCINTRWSAICGNYYWRESDAAVVCRQLGYSSEGGEGSSGRFGRSHTGQQVEFDYFQCSGSENNLSDCHQTVGQVCSFGDADVICKCPEKHMFPCVVTPPNEPYCVSELQFCDGVVDCPDGSDESVDCAQECSTPGELRLVNGDNTHGNEGRVEICFKGHWGTVCHSSWDYRDAKVVCRQLGFGSTGAVSYSGSHHGPGMGPVLLNNLGCTGVESNLTDCSHSAFGVVSSACRTHLYDVSVFCPTECADDRFTCTNGLISGQQPPCISTDQRCDGVIDCIGGEDELDHNCPCGSEGAVRLVDGIVPYRGRVEFCINTRWSAICGNYYWRESDAAVVCRQLGYSSEGADGSSGRFGGSHTGQQVEFDYFQCSGNENSLLDCHRTVGQVCSFGDADVICKCPEEHMFPCVVTPPNEPYCVSELQFCDGVMDCPDGSDEPVDCATECSTPGELRLVNGNDIHGNEGTVEICFKGRWGTVCHNSWDYRDAEVVCRQLGFGSTGAVAYTGSHYGPGMGPVLLNNLGCTGVESNLTDCSHSAFGVVSSACRTHLYDASAFCPTECADDSFMCSNGLISGQQPPCISADQRCDGVTDCIGGEDELDHNCPCGPEGAVRLVDGTVPYRGRVEFCKSGWWSTICTSRYYYWDNNDAAVVCHQLGYPREGAERSCCGGYFPIGPIQQPVLRDYFHCRGDEDSLSECPRAVGGVCDHTQDVSVLCTTTDYEFSCLEDNSTNETTTELQFCDGNLDCINGSDEPRKCPSECLVPGELRLVNGNKTGGLRGRVEICFGGQWGTICDDLWDYHDAEVVCRQLGLGTRGAVAYTGSHFGPGSGPVHLTGVSCLRSENLLTDCSIGFFGAVSSHCRDHLEDAGVSCPSICSENTFECQYGRLDGEQSPCISTDQRCDGVTDCIGGEDELDHNCPCGPEGAVRLVDGTVPYRGRVEFCINTRWSAICHYTYYHWRDSEAAVVCHQLGYSSAGAEASNGRFGRSHIGQPVEFDDFGCRGSENSLLECPKHLGRVCSYGEADVICKCPEEHMFPCVVTPPNEPYCVSELQFCDDVVDCPDGSDEPVDCAQECSLGEIRLVNGNDTHGNEGTVEICFKGNWGTVCHNSWDYKDAKVVCKQLGFGSIGAVSYGGSHYGPGMGPVLLNSLGCTGVESNLTNCSHSAFGVVSSACRTHLYDASVFCPTECADDRFACTNGLISGQQPPCISTDQRCDGVTDCIGGEDEMDHNCPCIPEGAVRLVDGIVPYQGRVEFCINTRWSAICHSNYYHWRNSEAAVVCHQLGYSSAGAEASNGRFGRSHIGQPVEFDDFGCRGSENSLLECPKHLGRVCSYGEADVICKCPEEHMFPCVVTPPNEPYCVSELQFCDGVMDCPDGSNEPVDCAQECSIPGEIQLANGDRNEGRVEICFNGHWGTVCHNSWDYRDAEVVCRQLGFGSTGAVSYGGSHYGPGMGPVLLNYLGCTGVESNLTDCSHSAFGVVSSACRTHLYDASVFCPTECPDNMLTCSEGRVDDHQPPCISTDQRCDGVIDCIGGEDELDHNCPCGPEGAVRLVDGIVPHRGRVEFCENTRWSTFCYSYYSWRFNAPVVCRQLGYPSAGAMVVSCCESYRAGPTTQPVNKDHYSCRGSENSLSQCTVYIGSTCSHSQDLSVICTCPMKNQFPCQDTAGNPQCISELQFCDGVSDCADGTDEPTDCLNECSVPGEIRLVNGAITDGNEGRVEICYKGQWGSVCQNSWNNYDTEVACRQLGLGTIGSNSYTGARYGRGQGPVFLNDVDCSGSEATLVECSRSYFGQVSSNCRDHSRDVSISCGKCPDSMFECKTGRVDGQQPPCISTVQRCDNIRDCVGGEDELDHNCPCEPEGAIRLIGGSGLHEGRLEFCRKSVWATVCMRYWGRGAPAVVCRQLGYTTQGVQAPRCCGDFGSGPSTQPVDHATFYCTGTENTLSECRQSPDHIKYCSHSYDASVICQV